MRGKVEENKRKGEVEENKRKGEAEENKRKGEAEENKRKRGRGKGERKECKRNWTCPNRLRRKREEGEKGSGEGGSLTSTCPLRGEVVDAEGREKRPWTCPNRLKW
jgi:hypothetical protein